MSILVPVLVSPGVYCSMVLHFWSMILETWKEGPSGISRQLRWCTFSIWWGTWRKAYNWHKRIPYRLQRLPQYMVTVNCENLLTRTCNVSVKYCCCRLVFCSGLSSPLCKLLLRWEEYQFIQYNWCSLFVIR